MIPSTPPTMGPAPRPGSSLSSSSSSQPLPTKRSKTTMEILTSNSFYRAAGPRACAGGVLGIVLGSGFGTVAAFEQIKLESPIAKRLLAEALQNGKSPSEAVDIATKGSGNQFLPSMQQLKTHRGVLGRTIGRTAMSFAGFLGKFL